MAGPPEPPVIVLGGDGDGGSSSSGDGGSSSSSSGGSSSSSGGSSSGGGGSSASPEDKRRPYRSLLLRLRIPVGLFADLVSRAAGEGWTADEFLWAMSNSKEFNRLFPGIQSLIDEGMSIPQAVATWKGMSSGYEEALRDAGLWGFAKNKLTPKGIGTMISQGIDAEEAVFRFSIAEQAKRSEATRQAFNAILKKKGQAQLDKRGWTRFLMGKADAPLYDLWEGVQLLQQLGPSGLTVKEARRLGKAIGVSGQPTDVSGALAAVERVQRLFGTQQLEDAGISAKDLALATLSEELTKPKLKAKAGSIIAQLEQLERNKTAAGAAVDRTAGFTRGDRPISGIAPQTGSSAQS